MKDVQNAEIADQAQANVNNNGMTEADFDREFARIKLNPKRSKEDKDDAITELQREYRRANATKIDEPATAETLNRLLDQYRESQFIGDKRAERLPLNADGIITLDDDARIVGEASKVYIKQRNDGTEIERPLKTPSTKLALEGVNFTVVNADGSKNSFKTKIFIGKDNKEMVAELLNKRTMEGFTEPTWKIKDANDANKVNEYPALFIRKTAVEPKTLEALAENDKGNAQQMSDSQKPSK